MKYEHLLGRSYVNLVRCSSDQQADTSPVDQLHILSDFASENEMVHAGDDVVLEGITGSLPGARDDIEAVIDRKQQRDDFDVLLVQDVSRFSRGGDDHIGYLKHRLAMVGVEVIFVTSGTTGDADADAVLHSMNGYASKAQVKNMSYAVVRGQMSSFAAGNIPHTFRVPYAIDRLYVGTASGQPRHRIRNLTDGTQLMLAVDEERVLARYGRNPKKGASLHYKRQSDERIVLIPGEAQQVEAVRRMYRRKLLDGWGSYRIAKELNESGTPAADGGPWTTTSVDKVLENPTYTGTGIAGRNSCGIFYTRANESSPKAVKRNIKAVATRRSKGAAPRPESDWRRQEHPLLENYLGDADLRQRAIDYQAQCLAKAAAKALAPAAAESKPGGDRHVDSPYVLKGLLRTLQGGYAMSGKLCGPKGYRRRYYKVTRGESAPIKGSALSKVVPAEPLEKAVLAVVKEVLRDEANLRDSVTRALAKEQAALAADRGMLAPLLAERDEIVEKLRDAMMLGPASRKLMAKEFAQWEARLAAVVQRIEMAEAASRPAEQVDVDVVVSHISRRFQQMADGLDAMPPVAVRELLASLVASLTVDLETREVSMELTLPTAASGDLCLVGTNSWTYGNEAQWSRGLRIASVTCKGERAANKVTPCFTCSRQAA
jgi:DNA invertase Pin-like site-specific DNA recombinase